MRLGREVTDERIGEAARTSSMRCASAQLRCGSSSITSSSIPTVYGRDPAFHLAQFA